MAKCHPEREDWGSYSTEDCDNFVAVKKYRACNKCYRRLSFIRGKESGLPLDEIGDKFWSKVQKHDEGSCWPWTGVPHQHGHGTFWHSNVSYHAHTVAYRLVHGEIPEGLVVDHKCRNRLCVNPSHLQAVTKKENTENIGVYKNNRSGYRGVTFRREWGKWRARVGHNNRLITVGHYDTPEEANEAVVKARLEYHTNNLEDRGEVYDIRDV